MSAPQLEDGYTRIANELLEALARVRVPGEARQVLDVIVRKTYGFNKKADQISASQFVEATGLLRQNVARGVRTLEALNLVNVTSNGASSPPTYTINKNYATWQPESKKIRGLDGGRIKNDSGSGIKNDSARIKNDSPDESKKIPEGIKNDSEANQKRFQGESISSPTKDTLTKEKERQKETTTTAAVTVRELSLLFNRYAGANIAGGGQIVVLQDFARDFTRETITEAFQAAAGANVEPRRFLSWCKTRMERRQVQEAQQAIEIEKQEAKTRRHSEITVSSKWQSTATDRVIVVTEVYAAFVEAEDLLGNPVPSILKSQLSDVEAWRVWDGDE